MPPAQIVCHSVRRSACADGPGRPRPLHYLLSPHVLSLPITQLSSTVQAAFSFLRLSDAASPSSAPSCQRRRFPCLSSASRLHPLYLSHSVSLLATLLLSHSVWC